MAPAVSTRAKACSVNMRPGEPRIIISWFSTSSCAEVLLMLIAWRPEQAALESTLKVVVKPCALLLQQASQGPLMVLCGLPTNLPTLPGRFRPAHRRRARQVSNLRPTA